MTAVYTNKQILFYLIVCCICHVALLYAIGSLTYAFYRQVFSPCVETLQYLLNLHVLNISLVLLV